MIEHEPWVGELYNKIGINNERIAVVGHSHYLREGDDHNLLTREVVEAVRGGKKISFFTQIRSYFEFQDDEDFLNRILFFNFVPSVVGSDKDKFAKGSQEQIDQGRERFRHILEKYLPHKVLVFTNSHGKGWETMPDTDEERIKDRLFRLGPDELKPFTWGTYKVKGHTILAFGLRHPQGAQGEVMTKAVRHIMSI